MNTAFWFQRAWRAFDTVLTSIDTVPGVLSCSRNYKCALGQYAYSSLSSMEQIHWCSRHQKKKKRFLAVCAKQTHTKKWVKKRESRMKSSTASYQELQRKLENLDIQKHLAKHVRKRQCRLTSKKKQLTMAGSVITFYACPMTSVSGNLLILRWARKKLINKRRECKQMTYMWKCFLLFILMSKELRRTCDEALCWRLVEIIDR